MRYRYACETHGGEVMNTIEDRVRSVEDVIALSEKAVTELQQDLRER